MAAQTKKLLDRVKGQQAGKSVHPRATDSTTLNHNKFCYRPEKINLQSAAKCFGAKTCPDLMAYYCY